MPLKIIEEEAGGVAQEAEPLPNKYEAPGSTPASFNNNNN
jgi:hypothetical protein